MLQITGTKLNAKNATTTEGECENWPGVILKLRHKCD